MTNFAGGRQKIARATAESYNQLADEYESRWAHYLQHTHQKFLTQFSTGDDDIVLDLSCGTGLLAQEIIHRGHHFQAFFLNDIALKLQAKAKQRLSGCKAIYFTGHSAEKLAFPDQKFSKIFCLSAFHNYEQQAEILANSYRMLQPGGQFFVLDWNRSGLFRIKNWFIQRSKREYIATKSARQMRQLLQQQNFAITHKESWYHGWWKFFYLIGEKPA